jgi:asparagine synthase (glutamine-hydrolysing)
MCGISGIFSFNEIGRVFAINLQKSISTLEQRGPDQRGSLLRERMSLGHTRLSIIDLSENGRQPMSDVSKRYHIVFNGEIYNYQELKTDLIAKGHQFKSESDTEVLLYHLIEYGIDGLHQLNGFFSLAFFDEVEHKLLLARDRYGIKPLYFFKDDDKFIFGSELKTILAFNPAKKEVNPLAVSALLQFNYIPGPISIYKGINKVLPGQYMLIDKSRNIKTKSFYKLPYSLMEESESDLSYDEAKTRIVKLLEESVEKRLVSDVPLGSFLSGGIDSSIITGIASKLKPDLKTFSIGFPDYPFFDESKYAKTVAEHFNTDHTSIDIRDGEMLEILNKSVDYFSEPFADSSSIAYYALCAKAKKELTVCLSGDGADELFGGYMKHQAWQMMDQNNWQVVLAKLLSPFGKLIPSSRKGRISNTNRRMSKLASNSRLNPGDRYFSLCKINSQSEAHTLINHELLRNFTSDFDGDLSSSMGLRRNPTNLNEVLFNDLKLVLPGDMLMKVDNASMANGLEVRVPFLDHNLVDFVCKLPSHWKADSKRRKKILVDSFENLLPKSIINRSKKGFEVPLQYWMERDLKSDLQKTVFNKEVIEDTGILNWTGVSNLEKSLYSKNPGDSAAKTFALYTLMKKITAE